MYTRTHIHTHTSIGRYILTFRTQLIESVYRRRCRLKVSEYKVANIQ